MALAGKVALVTGASRGIGKGIALQLGQAGATVYITGRTLTPSSGAGPGSLRDTADEINKRGGKAVPVACDHSKDDDIEKLFQQIQQEQNRLDILVNNAYSAVKAQVDYFGKPFWEIPESIWDEIQVVGLRNHYICATKAAKIMVKQNSGFIVNISSSAGKIYTFTPAYGIGKTALDRMAADCGMELKSHNITYISLWPGPIMTELKMEMAKQRQAPPSGETLKLGANAMAVQGTQTGQRPKTESIEFPGICIVALAQDPNLLERTGKIWTTPALGKELNLKDIDGSVIEDVANIAPTRQWYTGT